MGNLLTRVAPISQCNGLILAVLALAVTRKAASLKVETSLFFRFTEVEPKVNSRRGALYCAPGVFSVYYERDRQL